MELGRTRQQLDVAGWRRYVVPSGDLENEPPSEDLGTWVFAFGSSWNAGTPSAVILTEGVGGPTSDIIRLFDNPLNGAAMITFQSDPIIPEASTWAMMLLSFAGLGFAGYRARRHTPALAA